MQAVKSRDTKPELKVRRLLHRLGYRFRLHRKQLPGTPDIVFPGRRCVVFVHGCFWHGHDCPKGRLPKSRTDYWREKIVRNKERDAKAEVELTILGWRTLTIWQCETIAEDALTSKLTQFLGPPTKNRSTS